MLCDEIDRAEWSRLVAESATGTWFQTPEAYDFFASQPELFEPFILGVRSAQGLRGVCVGYVTKERSAFKQFFTRRAIIIGGPCLALRRAILMITAVGERRLSKQDLRIRLI